VLAFRRVIVPPSRPVNAAVSTKEPLETFMILYTPSLVGYSRHSLKFSDARGKIAKHPRGSLEYTTAGSHADSGLVNKNCPRASIWK
jgi:hypothetical protein